jgi:hypothetical protein
MAGGGPTTIGFVPPDPMGPEQHPGATEIVLHNGVVLAPAGAIPSPASTVTGPDAYGDAAVVGTGTDYARDDHNHGLPAATAVPAPASTVTGPDAYGASAVVGTGTAYARDDHNHGLPAAPTPTSPLAGAGGTGDATGGSVAYNDAAGAAGGSAVIAGGHANTHSDRPGGSVTASPGTSFSGAVHIASGLGASKIDVYGNDFSDEIVITAPKLVTIAAGVSGTAGQFLGSGPTAGDTVWLTPLVRHAAGVPSGAPTAGELPLAFDSTAVSGGMYFWDGSAWVKASTIP